MNDMSGATKTWALRWTELETPQTRKLSIERAQQPASVAEVLVGLRNDPSLRDALSTGLAELPFQALRWETPSLTDAQLGSKFESVVVDSPSLAGPQSSAAFDEYLGERMDPDVVVFSNLSGDATLIVPYSATPTACYAHLADFVRGAPSEQRHALWRGVASATLARVSETPVWLSTAGGGVPWLHVRLDDRPKYYVHAPYRTRR